MHTGETEGGPRAVEGVASANALLRRDCGSKPSNPMDVRPLVQFKPNAARWMGGAFIVAALTAGLVLAIHGAGKPGTLEALTATARISFLLFWLAYVGGALATLFGPAFQSLNWCGRELGLAFASAHTVHVGLVAWLCWIGATPVTRVFIFFGIALVCMYLLALCSIASVRQVFGRTGWRVLQIIGMNYIAYAFAVDFIRNQRYWDLKFVIAYLPFAILSVVGPMLVFASLMVRAGRAWRRRPAPPSLLRN